jgi:flagellar basal body-associated protein FliL
MSKRSKSPPKEEAAEEPKPGSKSPVIPAAIGLVVFAAAGAGAFFLTPIIAQPAAKEQSNEHGAAEKNEAKKSVHKSAEKSNGKKNDHGAEETPSSETFAIRGETGVYKPEPIVVSIRPNARFRHLKIGYAVETSAESAAAFEDNELRIRDALNAYLRAVDPQMLDDADSFGRLRAQMARRIAFVVAPAPVHAVMITDFILS